MSEFAKAWAESWEHDEEYKEFFMASVMTDLALDPPNLSRRFHVTHTRFNTCSFTHEYMTPVIGYGLGGYWYDERRVGLPCRRNYETRKELK